MTAWWKRLAQRRATSEQNETRAISLLWKWIHGQLVGTTAGVGVSETSALNLSGVWRAVDLLSSQIGMLPMHLYERTSSNTRQLAVDHPVAKLLTFPNPEMTPMRLREVLMAHVLLWGNAYCEIEWDWAARPVALWPMRPDQVTVERTLSPDRTPGELLYRYHSDTQGVFNLPAYRVLHIRGLSLDGVLGISVIGRAREDIGLGIATREYGSRFFSNGGLPGGVLTHPGRLSDEALARLRDDFATRHQGLSNAQRLAILEEGLEYKKIGVPPEDAQFLETRKFQISEIARWFGLKPHKLGDLERATFSNIEHQNIEHVTDSLQPWATRIEQEFNHSLLMSSERVRFYTRIELAGMLRGDTKSRFDAYGIGLDKGIYSINEVRALEDLNPVSGGDQHFVQLNMAPIAGPDSRSVSTPRLPAPASPEQRMLAAVEDEDVEERARRHARARHRLQTAQLPVFEAEMGRLLRREANDVANAYRRNKPAEFKTWLTEFYEDFSGVIVEGMSPVLNAYSVLVGQEAASEVGGEDAPALDRFIDAYLEAYALRHIARSVRELESAIDSEEPTVTTDTLFTQWREERPLQAARAESVRSNNAIAKAVYKSLGILTLRSIAFGDSCPFCTALDGQEVSIDSHFLSAGDEFQPEGAERPLSVSENKGHPPYHGGCDCITVAGVNT